MQRWHNYRSVQKWEIYFRLGILFILCLICVAIVITLCLTENKSFAVTLVPFILAARFNWVDYVEKRDKYLEQKDREVQLEKMD